MTTPLKPQSIISTGCFYTAGYLCLGAALTLGYQALFWYRQGAWVTYRMWTLFDWAGLQHSPTAPMYRLQPLFNYVWQVIGSCPITIALSLATAIIAFLGFLRESSYIRAIQLRDAH